MRILIVDNATHALQPLQQAFKDNRCQVAYVDNVLVAVKTIKKYKFDAIVVMDILTSSSGFDLLSALTLKYPQFIRIAVTQEEQQHKLKQVSHYLYSLPLSVDTITTNLLKVAEQQKKITKEIIVKSVANIKTLPSPPKVYLQLNAMLANDSTDSQKIADIITQDPALTAKILQISNSPSMNTGKPLSNIADAITKMGLEALSCVVMTAELFAYEPNIKGFSIIDEQLHSLAVAKFAATLVKPHLKQTTLLAGLLHDIGKVVLFEIDPQLTKTYFSNCSENIDNLALEQKVFGTDHCQIGGYLLHCWNFSYDLISVLLNHHSPEKLLTNEFGASQAVYLANCLLNKQLPHNKFIEHYKLTDSLEKLQARAERLSVN
ncbi:HDOD domain-containing protein [Thalassotalea piscium]|uniref:HD-like signal output (HDOD) protein n=1 Tax=Thalassotalea piscium TaxID=1230533 RepID=A0A7X0NK14_9GAMM|nr:HDOD domain-containing protein [Thalassotalea piscium]MBB6544840.1 HD-like signal output (HDOD) protein [Thalassotalea piscium]